MFTLLADAMFTATLNQRENSFPLHKQNHGETYTPRSQRRKADARPVADPNRYLW